MERGWLKRSLMAAGVVLALTWPVVVAAPWPGGGGVVVVAAAVFAWWAGRSPTMSAPSVRWLGGAALAATGLGLLLALGTDGLLAYEYGSRWVPSPIVLLEPGWVLSAAALGGFLQVRASERRTALLGLIGGVVGNLLAWGLLLAYVVALSGMGNA